MTIFKDFYEMYPDKFVNVTNGVTQRRWLLYCNPKLAELLNKRIGQDWVVDFSQIQKIANFANDPATQQEFLQVKRENKRKLIAYLREHDPIRDVRGKPVGHFSVLEEDALFDVHIKRIHEYKRQLMNVLHVLMVYHELKENPSARKVKRMVLIAGKAAPGYEIAKNVIQLIYCVARKINSDPATSHQLKLAFIENYNVSRAELIIPAADLSEQIPTAGKEASGTGNMKLTMNGALTIGTEDGANIEMHAAVTDQWWPFSFGNSAQKNGELLATKNYNPWDIYMHNEAIRRAVDSLRDHSLVENESEHAALYNLYRTLLERQNSDVSDRYFVLGDLQAYYDTQKKVEALYEKPERWAEYALHNIACMGRFSIDNSVDNYAKLVWGLQKCPVDFNELSKVRADYSEHDKCRIFNPVQAVS